MYSAITHVANITLAIITTVRLCQREKNTHAKTMWNKYANGIYVRMLPRKCTTAVKIRRSRTICAHKLTVDPLGVCDVRVERAWRIYTTLHRMRTPLKTNGQSPGWSKPICRTSPSNLPKMPKASRIATTIHRHQQNHRTFLARINSGRDRPLLPPPIASGATATVEEIGNS